AGQLAVEWGHGRDRSPRRDRGPPPAPPGGDARPPRPGRAAAGGSAAAPARAADGRAGPLRADPGDDDPGHARERALGRAAPGPGPAPAPDHRPVGGGDERGGAAAVDPAARAAGPG